MRRNYNPRVTPREKRLLAWCIVLSVVALLALIAVPRFLNGGRDTRETKPEVILPTLEVHFIDVGQGDAELLLCGGEAMLIDGGDEEHGEVVLGYLESLGIESLKYCVVTHYDSDHAAGLDDVLKRIPCELLISPNQERDTKTFYDMRDVVRDTGTAKHTAQVGDSFTLGSADFTIIGPPGDYYEESNDYSLVMMVEHGGNSFLFTGDMEKLVERELLDAKVDVNADVLKVSHHGSKKSSLDEFVEAVSPEYAVISCAAGNDYGHPHNRVLRKLRSLDTKLYRTDDQGTIICYSDGVNLAWNKEPSESWQPGVSPAVATEEYEDAA